MRVVKEGVLPFDVYGTCKRCQCEVEGKYGDQEVERYEHQRTDYYDMDWVVEIRYRCKCPTEGCGEIIYLSERSRR